MQQVQLFSRPQTRKWTIETAAEVYREIWVKEDATLSEILIQAFSSKHSIPKGTSKTGVFEVQTDKGIYYSNVNRRLDPSTKQGLKNISFQSWEELQALEEYQRKAVEQWSLETGRPTTSAPEHYPFNSKEEELGWFPTLDEIPKERNAMEKCKVLYTLSGVEWFKKFDLEFFN